MKVVTLTDGDNGREVSVPVGATLRVELKTQAGTGYGWYVEEVEPVRLKLEKAETVDMAPRGVAGGPELGVWSFKPVSSGDTRLRMLYYRVWEGKDKAVNKYEVKIHITGG